MHHPDGVWEEVLTAYEHHYNQANDIEGICRIHRSCSDPWQDVEEGTSWVTHRLSRGFYIQVALLDGLVVGHGEWIVSDEPAGKYLYLGVLQVDADYQRQVIGRKMIEDGARYAAGQGCSSLVTIPENDPGVNTLLANHPTRKR